MSFLEDLPKPFFVLAPMDDVTDVVFRRVVAECAPPDVYFTEFVNVDGLQSAGRQKLLHKLEITATERPIIAQIWGKDPENYYKTTKDLIAMGFDGVDINMGCPDRTIVKNGCCAALINNRGLTEAIIDAVREGASGKTDFPISVKTRLGFSGVDLSWHEFLLHKKLNMLTIHGRTAKEMSVPPANWNLIGQIREMRDSLATSTLIVGNGDVQNRTQGLELAKHHKLDGIMIGRGVFHDPYAFAVESKWADLSREERIVLYRRHVELFAQTYLHAERRIATLNKFCKIYINGFDGAKELREQLMAARSTNELLTMLA